MLICNKLVKQQQNEKYIISIIIWNVWFDKTSNAVPTNWEHGGVNQKYLQKFHSFLS